MYDTEPWSDMFVASAGAAAALAGLVFVAVSLNIAAIVRTRPFRERALSTVLLLLGAVTVSVLSLSPQPRHALGIELVVVGSALVCWLGVARKSILDGARRHPVWIPIRALVVAPGSITYVGGGVSLLVHAGGGLYWLMFGIVGAMVGSVINAWVLLVEILR